MTHFITIKWCLLIVSLSGSKTIFYRYKMAREHQGTGSSVVGPVSSVKGDGLSLAEWWMRVPTVQVWASHTPPDTLPKESSTAACSLNEGSMQVLERRRLDLELGPGGDHDVSYTFALPVWMPQVLAWTRLLAQVQRGEVEP